MELSNNNLPIPLENCGLLGGCFKGILNPLDLCFRLGDDGNDVETAGHVTTLLLQVEIGSSRQASLLGETDGCRRGSIIAVFPIPDLNKNEMLVVHHDQVNLTHAAQEITPDQFEPPGLQIIERLLLGPVASLPAAHLLRATP